MRTKIYKSIIQIKAVILEPYLYFSIYFITIYYILYTHITILYHYVVYMYNCNIHFLVNNRKN